ncbi:hypothetical protein JKA74_14555 [Marivirga sp. S37H4]|uniref:Uncharacterized protein n=1 Tax=Marivirga aurantiaca TaxID=2802615 RepID=A0A934WZV3_9BACT|nr:hypothetical protein [Marivirga aurantiaca]MBK6266264.1 hypothetical protein [Marivirga aurantiaca]
MLQKESIIDHLGSFLYDFAYTKIAGKDIFEQGFSSGKKMVILNISPYSDGLMTEVLLGLSFLRVEEILHQFSNRLYHKDDISLTYWINLSHFSDDSAKRYFVTSNKEFQEVVGGLEESLVKNGFYWLDDFSNENSISSRIHQDIVSNNVQHKNLYMLCQRSLILQSLLSIPITDDTFYTYYEILQLHNAPEIQLEEFLRFRMYVQELNLN